MKDSIFHNTDLITLHLPNKIITRFSNNRAKQAIQLEIFAFWNRRAKLAAFIKMLNIQ